MRLTNKKGEITLALAATVLIGSAALLIANDFVNGDGFKDVDRNGVSVEETSAKVGTANWRP